MSNSIHNKINSDYQKKRKLAFDDLMYRKQKIYKLVPQIEDIDDQIHYLGLKYNKMILEKTLNFNDILSALDAEIEKLKSKKLELIKEYGYPENYLNISYGCPLCYDTGYIEEHGKTSRCTCYKQQLMDILFEQSNLKITEYENFANFNENFYPDTIDSEKFGLPISPRENILAIKERSQKFVENFNNPEEKNLFFFGPTGLGKTFISNCIAEKVLSKGNTVIYQTAPKLFELINEYKKNSFKNEPISTVDYKNIYDSELLIIDDLGTESTTSSRYAELLNIINSRLANNLKKPCKTIISTNLSPKELYKLYTERVASRIIGCFDIYKFIGEDIRISKILESNS